MKKIITIILILFLIIIISKKEYNLTEDTIRFRVIANSNSSKDILNKEKVVSDLSGILFNNKKDINNEREYIINNLELIQSRIDDLFKSNNYDKNYNVNYGLNYFPEKEYNGKIFKAGNYESLLIEIGEGKGNNYWCILYPPLCMVDNIKEREKVEYKFKILEIFKKIF